ncbi:MAG: putative toxin-antitoxin system toxin component, PIN family [Solirubrobacterales bacterium]
MRRLVIDANILASGSVDPHGESPPSLIYRDLDGSRFEAIVCPELLGEVADALRKPYFLDQIGEEGIDDLVAGIAEAATVLDDPVSPPAVLRDPDDDYLVALALEANAEAIVTGDRDLLDHDGLAPPALDARAACKVSGLLE